MTLDLTLDADFDRFVQAELARRRWSLASEPSLFSAGDTFSQRVRARAEEWRTTRQRPFDAKLVSEAVTHEYCHLLQAAVMREYSQVQSIAIQESIDYVWNTALKRCGDHTMAQNAVFRAVMRAWVKIDTCHPGSYLAWFTAIVNNEIRQELRRAQRQGKNEIDEADLDRGHDNPDEEGDEDPFARFEAHQAETTGDTERRIMRPAVVKALRDCLHHARREFIILAQFFFELNPSEIAQYLASKVTQMHMEKHRALRQARNCPKLIAVLRDALT